VLNCNTKLANLGSIKTLITPKIFFGGYSLKKRGIIAQIELSFNASGSLNQFVTKV